jgi:hypothetical protein
MTARGWEWEAKLDETLKLRPEGGGLVVRSRAGTFVVTQAGDPDDHVLGTGDVFRTSRRGLVVVWALSRGTISARSGAEPVRWLDRATAHAA